MRLLGFLLLLLIGTADAATYYVATTGTDNVGCGATGSPCATIQYILNRTPTVKLAAGDTIKVRAGTYTSQDIDMSDTTNHDNVTITAEDAATCTVTSTCPLIQGTNASPADVFIASGVSGVTISYLRVRNKTTSWSQFGGIGSGWSGVFTINGQPTTIDHCEIFNGGNGVGIGTNQGVTIQYSVIHDGGGGTWPTCSGDDNHGIGIYNWGGASGATGWSTGFKFLHNTIYNMEGDGIQDVSGYACDNGGGGCAWLQYWEYGYNTVYNNCEQGFDFKGAQYVKIHDNEIYDNGYGGIGTNDSDNLADYQHEHWWIWNNIIHDHDNYAIFSQEGDDGYWMIWNNVLYNNVAAPQFNWGTIEQPPHDSVIVHNLIFNNNSAAGGNSSRGLIAERGSTVIVRNNVFYNNGVGDQGNIYSGSNATIDHNYCYPSSPGTCGSSATTTSDPGITDLNGGNYMPTAASTLRGKGTSVTADSDFTVGTDLLGNATRETGGGSDYGPVEYAVTNSASIRGWKFAALLVSLAGLLGAFLHGKVIVSRLGRAAGAVRDWLRARGNTALSDRAQSAKAGMI